MNIEFRCLPVGTPLRLIGVNSAALAPYIHRPRTDRELPPLEELVPELSSAGDSVFKHMIIDGDSQIDTQLESYPYAFGISTDLNHADITTPYPSDTNIFTFQSFSWDDRPYAIAMLADYCEIEHEFGRVAKIYFDRPPPTDDSLDGFSRAVTARKEHHLTEIYKRIKAGKFSEWPGILSLGQKGTAPMTDTFVVELKPESAEENPRYIVVRAPQLKGDESSVAHIVETFNGIVCRAFAVPQDAMQFLDGYSGHLLSFAPEVREQNSNRSRTPDNAGWGN